METTFNQAAVDQLAEQLENKTVLIIDGGVYVIDKEFPHPGGKDLLASHSGQDVSALFHGTTMPTTTTTAAAAAETVGAHSHSKAATALLSQFYLGPYTQHYNPQKQQQQQQQTKRKSSAAKTDKTNNSAEHSHQPPPPPPPAPPFINESLPILCQLRSLSPAQYQTWLRTPSPIHPRFFKSDWVESLTKVNWWVVPFLWLPIAAAFLVTAFSSYIVNSEQESIQSFSVLCMLGLLAWQALEYTLHRFVFHAKPTGSHTILFHFLVHGCHHKFPMDPQRLVFPPAPAFLIALLVYSIFRMVLSSVFAAHTVFGAFLVGYVGYDMLHHFMHSAAVGGPLKAAHMKHHFVDTATGYGISSPLFDWMFGTLPDRHSRQKRYSKEMNKEEKIN